MFFRTADGLSETVATQIAGDVGWFALNVGDGNEWPKWSKVVTTARANGVTCFPWRRCFNEDGLHALMELASDHTLQPLPNVETELEGDLPPAKMAEVIGQYPVSVVGVSTLGWLQNAVDFSPIAHLPALLQIFPTDMREDPQDLPRVQRECVTHARDKGFRHVGVTLQTYGSAHPDWYDYHSGTRSYYTGDDIGAANWGAWAP